MKKIYEIVTQIASTSSRNEKETILNNNKENELLSNIFQFIFNPYIVTGISSKKYNKFKDINSNSSITNIKEMMEYLKVNNTGRDMDIKSIIGFINDQDEQLRDVLKQIATKSLKIGVTAKTLNKVYGKGFIPEFNVMLADKYFTNQNRINGEFIVTTKLDGGRAVIIKENGNVKFFTRQGQPIEDMVEIQEEVKSLPDNMVYDGELLLRNDKKLASKDLYRATMKETRKDGIKKNLIFNCFDIIPINDFINGKCKTPCIERKNQLHDLLSNLNLEHIIEVPMLYIGTDKNEIIRLLDEARSKDKEGVMVNLSNAPYECKRSKNLLKVKIMQSADLKIIGFEKGEGKLSNTLGKILVDYKGNQVGVGSGFSDQDREYIWNNQNDLLGKIVEVQYFEETQNQNGGISLRFPVFKGIRIDKTEPSYY
ncbi:ATP-dependent DNA ligase (plasmid) [Clostridium botulinum]|uniref:ATP-dependent DNA ligase n=1 Tax=Clostridium botulinum TaxID=1491 RepID=UPI0006A559AA|nr:hypothetical protein [Clostridium botulinum]KOC56879.1 hypothetical protein ADU89_01400 [Clostridium botulinum]KOC57354.1 hypothetical protein ADU90_05940 [Clostridium botulinum]MCD3232587.1 ATP-dependent DNA ligase [Clostridium botulinum D/C]MCD3238484.1 ATP-dependent DNA ligase [Clostridium botulinum D/C]MCD3265996.1 ATP-dependent DNA ligase [Clostridium botulinum D/C]